MGKPLSLQMSMGSEWSSGDGGSQPDGTTRLLQNILPRPNRFPSRPPFAYDNLMAVNGLAALDDLVNNVVRLIAVDTSQHLYVKSATAGSETWSSANATSVDGVRLTSSTRYRGVSYLSFSSNAGVPNGMCSYDGVTVNTNPLGTGNNISPRVLSVYGERLQMSSPRLVIGNQLSAFPWTKPYDWSTWTLSNCASQVLSDGATKTCRVTPTATTGAYAYVSPSISYPGQVKLTWRQDLRGTSATYAMPFTLEVVAVSAWMASQSYSVGDMVVDSNENWQRCKVAGTSGGSTPSWNTTLNSNTTDGGVTWSNGGSAVMASSSETLPTADPVGLWSTYTLTATIPPLNGGTISINFRFKFGNSDTPTIQLVPIDVSYRDGLADGDRAKSNRGAQSTGGDFSFPFFNVETSASSTLDSDVELWSEIGLPTTISAANTYRLTAAGATGFATNACVIGNRKLTFKRSAFWQFMQTGDPDTPIRVEHLNTVIGCVGPLALDVWNDTAFFIGEYDIFSYNVGSQSPTPLCGDGMREEIMARGSNWVESQSTYNRPILRVDQAKLIVWVYTQKGKLYAYDLQSKSWSTHTVSIGIEIDCMEWNRNTGSMYVSFGGHGLTRMDYTSIAKDIIDNTATQYDVDCTVIFKPIELYSPPRYDYSLQQLRFMHAATADQTGQTTTAAYSFDQGRTFAKSSAVTVAPLSVNGEFVPLRFSARQGRATITAKLSHVGKTGEVRNADGTISSAWSLSPRSYADVIVRREERVRANPTQGASNL